MQRIYFVRHGQTKANVENTAQGLEDPLTPEGEMQAMRVAERLTTLPIARCISSDALRTRQTSSHIEDQLKMPFTYSALFREIARPSQFVGHSRTSPEYAAFIKEDMAHWGEDWHFADEENYPDRVRRAKAALQFLTEQPEEDILVVTHGHFLRFMVSTILTNGALTPELWMSMNKAFWTSNTAITVCTHHEGHWRLMTWNDHAHFGDTVFRPTLD